MDSFLPPSFLVPLLHPHLLTVDPIFLLAPFAVMPAVVVRQRKAWRRKDGVFIYFEDNGGVIVNNKGEMKGRFLFVNKARSYTHSRLASIELHVPLFFISVILSFCGYLWWFEKGGGVVGGAAPALVLLVSCQFAACRLSWSSAAAVFSNRSVCVGLLGVPGRGDGRCVPRLECRLARPTAGQKILALRWALCRGGAIFQVSQIGPLARLFLICPHFFFLPLPALRTLSSNCCFRLRHQRPRGQGVRRPVAPYRQQRRLHCLRRRKKQQRARDHKETFLPRPEDIVPPFFLSEERDGEVEAAAYPKS